MTDQGRHVPGAAGATDKVANAEHALRERINEPRFRSRLTEDRSARNQIASSLDAIGDTTQALSAYLTRYPRDPDDTGIQYLFAYGALQALFIQQDATIHLSEALGGKGRKAILTDERLDTARQIRNRAVGHPTRKDRPLPVTTHQIGRITLGPGGFEMLTAGEDGSVQFETVDLAALIEGQADAVAENLEGLAAMLDRQDEDVRRKFQHDRLQAVFPSTLGHTFEKLSQATREHGPIGLATLAAVTNVVPRFTEAMQRRGLTVDSYPGVQAWYAEIQHPIRELEAFFDITSPSTLHPETAAILVRHLRERFDELKGMAASIDEEWRLEQE